MFVHAPNLKKVSKSMFKNCSNLQKANFVEVEIIEEEGFEYCSLLGYFEANKLK